MPNNRINSEKAIEIRNSPMMSGSLRNLTLRYPKVAANTIRMLIRLIRFTVEIGVMNTICKLRNDLH